MSAPGAAAGTTDLTDGVFRHLVVTGRSRVALYFARIPAGLAILAPLVAAAFMMVCLVTSFAGVSNPSSVNVNGTSVPSQLDQSQLKSWVLAHPAEASNVFNGPGLNGPGPGAVFVGPGPAQGPGAVRAGIGLAQHQMGMVYSEYQNNELTEFNPALNEMVKIGLWIGLEAALGFMVGLGFSSLIGQRTVTIIVLIALYIIVTPILAEHVIPYFIDGQRLVVGVAMDQLRPAGLAGGGPGGGGGGPGHVLFGGKGVLGIPAMPTWAMISVIVGWFAGWTGLGAWRMATRDA